MSWRLREKTVALDTRWLRVYRNEYSLPNGTDIDDFYVVERDDFVLIVAERDDCVVLVRQYRPATDRYYFSLPAGYLRKDEPPEVAARRELLEEAGLEGEAFTMIGELHPLPGYIKSFAYVVSCRALKGAVIVHDNGEIESAKLVPWSTALEMIRAGQINEMQAVSALLFARLVAGGRAENG
jgi:8-oxo-dGTP pyrophosphatase MutT (NUDIX family)